MSDLSFVIPLSLGIVSFTFFYLANNYRKPEKVGWFELFFTFANVFLLAGLFILSTLLQEEASFTGIAAAVLGLFQGLLWIYILIIAFMFLKFLKYLMVEVLLKKAGEIGLLSR